MPYIATVLLLFLPGALAAFLHRRLRKRTKSAVRFLVYPVYTAVIDAAVCGFKLLHGASIENFFGWFYPPLSFMFYFTAACAMAVVLPLIYILIAEKRLAVRCDRDAHTAANVPRLRWDGKKALRVLLRMACVLLAGILIGFLLVTATYLLPLENIQENVRESAATVESEGSYPFLYSNWRSTRLDNFTDSIMMLIAAYEGDQGLIGNAMLSTYTRFADCDPAEGLVKWATGATDGMETHSYARYWHGYLIWLKPLLEVCNYSQIRVINTVLQILLMAAALAAMWVKKQKRLLLPFLLMWLFLTPVALFKSFQFSWIFYVCTISTLVLLLRYQKLDANRSFYLLFLITGMATSYVDFLTYPLITLGVPLAVYVVLRGRRTWKQGVADVAALSLVWGIGYVGIWAGKWALCSLLTGSDVLLTVQGNISARMSNAYDAEVFTWVDTVKRNIEAYNHWIYLGPFLLCLAGYALLYGREQIHIRDRRLAVGSAWIGGTLLPLLLAALIPFAWYFVASNHTYIHYWFAHRTLAISALAVPAVFARRGEPDR